MQGQPLDLAVESVEVRGDPGVPGGQLAVTARIRRLDSGPPDSVIAIVRFRSSSDARPLADRRITLAPPRPRGDAIEPRPRPACTDKPMQQRGQSLPQVRDVSLDSSEANGSPAS